MADLADTIKTNAEGPAEVRGDSGSMKQHPLQGQIDAARFVAAQNALDDRTKPTLGIRLATLKAPGAV